MYLDITIKQLPQGVIHLFLRRLFFIGLPGIYYRMDRIPCADSDLYDRDWNNVLCDG